MQLFHGSKRVIETPVFGVGSIHNDYGLGFYCTEHEDLANEWACQGDAPGYCNVYALQAEGLRTIDLNGSGYHILNWIAVLVQNRVISRKTSIAQEAEKYLLKYFVPDISSADIIRGYRADDSYFAYARDFLNNALSVQQLNAAMHLGELGEQVVLKSKQSFQRIKFVEARPVSEIFREQREARDKRARDTYLATRGMSAPATKNGLYMLDIMRRELTDDDAPLFRNIS